MIGRMAFWGIMLIIIGFALLYAPWIVFVGQEVNYTTDPTLMKTFQSVNHAKEICATNPDLENPETFCKYMNWIEIGSYSVVGAGLLLFLLGLFMGGKPKSGGQNPV